MERMIETIRYRGREITRADITFIRELIACHPDASRRRLSRLLCEAWNWRQENGALRDMVCRGMMLMLHRAGHITLPPPRFKKLNPMKRKKPERVEVDTTPVRMPLRDLQPIAFHQVRRTPDERIVNGLVEEHHPLGYTQPVGEHLKYMVRAASGRPVACLLWCSAPRHIGPRDRYIGWSREARKANVRFIAYNTRYLIFPWVEVPHLASHILGRLARRIADDWVELYSHPVYFLETFVNPATHKGTCYRAANWVLLGRTKGRGNNDVDGTGRVPVKEMLGYPLIPHFRAVLSEVDG